MHKSSQTKDEMIGFMHKDLNNVELLSCNTMLYQHRFLPFFQTKLNQSFFIRMSHTKQYSYIYLLLAFYLIKQISFMSTK